MEVLRCKASMAGRAVNALIDGRRFDGKPRWKASMEEGFDGRLPWKRIGGRPRWKRFDGRLGGKALMEGPCGVLWPLSMEDLEGRVSKEGIAKGGLRWKAWMEAP